MDPIVVLVTGGNRGIGSAIAKLFASNGAQVVACGRTAPDAPLPAGVTFVECDVTDPSSVRRMFDGLPRLDVLVNNAGITGDVKLDDPDDSLWHAIIDTNLNGTYYCSKAAVPLLARQGGRIINIASVLGLKGVADGIGYCAAKHGVVGLTRAMALALARQNITVNAVCPGWVSTEMAEERWRELGIDEAIAAAGTPTGRVSSAEEIASAVAWLASPQAHNMTGQTLVIDGGATA